jgi:hypothetical protein
MTVTLFLSSLGLTLAVVGTALLYLRSITRSVLREQCASDAGAEFWLRTVDVLALAGSLILVLAFGGAAGGSDPVVQLRLTLGLALAGVFVAVVLVSSNVWRSVAGQSTASTAVAEAA